jgi:hypothetical protein
MVLIVYFSGFNWIFDSKAVDGSVLLIKKITLNLIIRNFLWEKFGFELNFRWIVRILQKKKKKKFTLLIMYIDSGGF